MSEVKHVQVINHCTETILVYISRPRSKKESTATKGRRTKYTLLPEHLSLIHI